jgi:hypothetical protein
MNTSASLRISPAVWLLLTGTVLATVAAEPATPARSVVPPATNRVLPGQPFATPLQWTSSGALIYFRPPLSRHEA